MACSVPTRCSEAPTTEANKGVLNIDALLDKYSLKEGRLQDNAGDKSLRYI